MNATSPPALALAAFVGLLAGTHAAIWGMYKDAIHEGFTRKQFVRSMIVASLSAVALQLVLRLPLPGAAALVMLWGLAYATERGIVEVWKTFFREEDQSKYFIPMTFSIRGVPVRSRAARLSAGFAYIAVVGLCLYGIAQLDRGLPGTQGSLDPVRTALVGLSVGLIIAVGGAWKDAPKEGFEILKFFRSPIMTVTLALLLSRFTGSYLLVTVASIGFERAAIETYKTFFFPDKPRGKFAGKPVLHPHMLTARRRFVPVYVAIWVAVVTSSALAIAAGPQAAGGAPWSALTAGAQR
jgi:hypothetical protein